MIESDGEQRGHAPWLAPEIRMERRDDGMLEGRREWEVIVGGGGRDIARRRAFDGAA